jgi:hypothetical protein
MGDKALPVSNRPVASECRLLSSLLFAVLVESIDFSSYHVSIELHGTFSDLQHSKPADSWPCISNKNPIDHPNKRMLNEIRNPIILIWAHYSLLEQWFVIQTMGLIVREVKGPTSASIAL